MTTPWNDIPDASLDGNKPWYKTLARRMRDNLIAALEGALGAPKIALKSDGGAFGPSGNSAHTGLDAWSGVWFTVGYFNSHGSVARDLTMSLSGGGVSGSATLRSVPANSGGTVSGFVDFATGLARFVWSDTSGGYGTYTFTSPSLNITGITFTAAADLTCGVMIHPNGGESAS